MMVRKRFNHPCSPTTTTTFSPHPHPWHEGTSERCQWCLLVFNQVPCWAGTALQTTRERSGSRAQSSALPQSLGLCSLHSGLSKVQEPPIISVLNEFLVFFVVAGTKTGPAGPVLTTELPVTFYEKDACVRKQGALENSDTE